MPVIDLLRGNVVHAIAGNRSQYLPVNSILSSSTKPADVTRALRECFDFAEVYVADLDAIQGERPNRDDVTAISESGLRIWLDAGLRNVSEVDSFSGAFKFADLVIGTETLCEPQLVREAVARLASDRVVVSIDMHGGILLAPDGAWQSRQFEYVAEQIIELGVRRFIILDLADVGVAAGPSTLSKIEWLRRRGIHLQIAAGGGVRNLDDLRRLESAGADVALVSTALHTGALTARDLQAIR